MIRFLIDTTVSKRDVSGNCYHYSVVTSTKTGRNLIVATGWGSDGGNIRALLRNAGLEWSELHYSERVIGKREFKQSDSFSENTVHEHEITDNMIFNLEKEG